MAKTLPLQLSLIILLLVTCFTVFAEDENIVSWIAMPPHLHGGYYSVTPEMAPSLPHHPPTPTPTTPPAHPPSNAPVQPPTSHPYPPAHPPNPSYSPTYPPNPSHPFERKLVAVQGIVFLKSCKYAGNYTLSEATPVAGAIVKLQCNNTAKPLTAEAQTDMNGYFLLLAPRTITNYAVHKCTATLLSTKLPPLCKQPSDLQGGVSGAMLYVDKTKPFITVNMVEYALLNVGPFAFEPNCPH